MVEVVVVVAVAASVRWCRCGAVVEWNGGGPSGAGPERAGWLSE